MKQSRKRIAEVQKIIHIGREKGYLTTDEIKERLPAFFPEIKWMM